MSNSTVRTIVLDAAGNEFLQWPIAEPADILDYLIDATLAVGNDYIASASVSVTRTSYSVPGFNENSRVANSRRSSFAPR